MTIFEQYPQLKMIQKIAIRKKVSLFLVGGFLRDHLLKRKKWDFDFAVEKKALNFAKTFAHNIKGAYVLLDDERGCARVAKKTKEGLMTFDFADYRAKTFKGDLSHRDFTINTLSLDVLKIKESSKLNALIKDVLKAKSDFDKRTIRMVHDKVFVEDPLRMLRAFSLKADLGFKIEKETMAQIKKDRDLIGDVSYERIREEFFKVLGSDKAGRNLKAMGRIGLLERFIPQVRMMFDCKQGTYHHLDVWPHSLETVVQVDKLVKEYKKNPEMMAYLREPLAGTHTRLALIKLAALLHDIGKPDTRKKEQNHLTFHGHEHVGKKIAKHVSKLLKLSTRERFMICDLIFYHLRPGYLSNFKKPSDRMVYRFLRDTKDEAVSVLILSLADQRSTCGPLTTQKDQEHHQKICMALIEKYFVKKKEKPFVALVNGNDVMKFLKLKSSPLVGKILKELIEKQHLGKIKTKKEALQWAGEMVEKGKTNVL